MIKLKSQQSNVMFIYCESPIEIDKSKEWGSGNKQLGPNGAFLKINEDQKTGRLTISHLVQANEDGTHPVGWVPSTKHNRFDKSPIWIDETILTEGQVIKLNTLDGEIEYVIKENSHLCYNDIDNKPNMKDVWIQTVNNINKNYING